MMKANTYGLKMKGLKKASGETCTCRQGYVQISYDMDDGEVIATYHADTNSWSEFRGGSVLTVCGTDRHMTMQEIADVIAREVSSHKACCIA